MGISYLRRALLAALLPALVTATTVLAGVNGSASAGLPVGRRADAVLLGRAGAPPPDAPLIHVVKRGETLSIIARRYGVGVRELVALNRIANPDRIYAGQVLSVPARARPTPAVPSPTPLPEAPCPCEEIVISSPCRAMTVTSPVTVSGFASSPFEQTVAVAVLDGSGRRIGLAAGIIVGEMGQRGPFSVTAPFTIPLNSQLGRIQVFTESPRDGATVHLSSVTVGLQGLGLDAHLEALQEAVAAKDYAALQGLMGPQFVMGGYASEWVQFTPAEAIALLRSDFIGPGESTLDFSVDARQLLGDRAVFPADAVHVVFSAGWGESQDDDAFLMIGEVDGRARWIGMLYVRHALIDYR